MIPLTLPPSAPVVTDAPTVAPSIADRLEGAAALIEERGGCDGHEDKHGRLCVIGAALKSGTGSAWVPVTLWGDARREAHAVYADPIALALGYSGPESYRVVAVWNDRPGRTDAERAALLRKAAALSRAQVSA